MGKRPSFEKSLEALEEIVAELEGGQLTLDEALERYERGVATHKACVEMLAAAEKRIEVLLKGSDGQLTTGPLKADDAPPREDEP